jgi:hypothetical protein
MKKHTTRLALALLVLAGLVSACGGGGGDDCCIAPPAPGNGSALPASALADSNGLVTYLKDLIANHTDSTSEPVALGTVTLPSDNAIEPISVN